MTKKVRIENADCSDHKIEVQVWNRAPDGKDDLIQVISLDNPTAMIDVTIWDTKYIIIKEKCKNAL